MTLYRITAREYAATAFSGNGARIYGGRWNSPGRRMVYASTTLELCVLEVLAHFDPLLAPDYVFLTAEVPEDTVERLEPPAAWDRLPHSASARACGDRWIDQARSLVALVPSAVLPFSTNALINPTHPRFGEIEIGEPRDLLLDARLLGDR